MPELPEAETIVRGLRQRVVGREIVGTHVTHADVLGQDLSPERLARTLEGRRIEGVTRRGKNVVLLFNPGIRLVVNLGMTGRLVASGAARAGELTHVAIRFDLDDGQAILFDDVRRFGRFDLFTATTWPERERQLGVEPLSDALTADRMYELTRGSRTAIRNWLLDQRRVAGVGNIYASEALFRARIRPGRAARRLSRKDAAALRDALRDVLEEAIVARGTTFSDYRDSEGESGGFGPRLRVYGREGEPCPTCGTPIKRSVLSNRSAFYCPSCQK